MMSNETWKQIRRSPYQSITAVLVMTVFFFVGYLLSLVLYSGEKILTYFETRPQVIAFFAISAPIEEVQRVADRMKTLEFVREVTLVSKEQALDLYRAENAEDPLLLELVTADILPASVEVSATSVEYLGEIEKELQTSSDQLDEVVFQRDVVHILERWTRTIRLFGVSSAVVLGVVSFLVMVVVISSKVAQKKREIQTKRLLGATLWFVQKPFLLEASFYGILGGLLGWGVSMLLLLYSTPYLIEFFGEIELFPIDPIFFAAQIGVGFIYGIFVGLFASSVALRRFIK